ncbi:transcriptional repressor LexA [Aquimarina sp. 2201CG1-2-11]|uniref:transcriptional repressor LexA n=1 Tax=Aquimarina discodermiae TaxID=3231043 RepID=UPI0034617D29
MNRIKEVLEDKGIKQTWLAERLEKSYNMVNSYVQNRRQPSLEDLFKIAKILDVAVAELLETNTSKKKYSSIQSTIFQTSESEGEYEKMVSIPVLGNVACGHPLFAEENIETEISVSTKLIRKGKNYFILRASGDSMNKANIDDGDLVLIRQEQTAEDGDKVVALIDDEATIKEFCNQGNMIVLKPQSSNKEHQPIILTRNFKIQGIVESIIKI